MITKEALLAAGYKPFKSRLKQYTDQGYQKRFDDEHGKRYFITVWEYDNRPFKHNCPQLNDFNYAPDSQFEIGTIAFNVEMLTPESVEEMEAFFERIWVQMGCDYYERWIDD